MDLENNINNFFSLKKKNILITGGSSGIGLHAAKLYLNFGANVIITARRKKQLDLEIKKANNKNFNSYINTKTAVYFGLATYWLIILIGTFTNI